MSLSSGRRVRAALVSLAALGLAVTAASPALADAVTPVAPTKLINGGQACATDQSSAGYYNANNSFEIEGAPTLSDGSLASASIEYQLWPVSDPTQVTSWTLAGASNLESPLNVPGNDFADGQTYAWDAATVYNGATSDWSAPCYVNIDETAPANAPTVTSTNYPSGVKDQAGAPVHVTFGANGVSDVVGYVFSWTSMPIPEFNGPLSDPYLGPAGSEPASSLGGSATLDLVPSQPSFYMRLTVESVDRAGNISPTTTYQFYLNGSSPTITMQGHLASYDKPTTFDLTPDAGINAASPVTAYNVMIAGDPSGQKNYTIAANADGTAQTQITFDAAFEWVQISSVSADGWISDAADYSFNSAPKVSSDVYAEGATSGGIGVKGTFTFEPTVKGVVSYSYSWDYGTTQTTVAAHDGKASICWTPTASGSYDLEVYAVLADGTQLSPYDYSFNVS